MAEDTGALREEIEETRRRVGDEVDALSYKTDVGARLGDYVEDKKDAVTSKVTGARDAVTSTVSKAVPSGQQLKSRGRRLRGTAERNPLGLAVGGAAVGFVAGLLTPSTRMEDERLGEVSDRVKETAREAGHEALERGQGVIESAIETVKSEGTQQGQEMASDLKERIQQDSPEPV